MIPSTVRECARVYTAVELDVTTGSIDRPRRDRVKRELEWFALRVGARVRSWF